MRREDLLIWGKRIKQIAQILSQYFYMLQYRTKHLFSAFLTAICRKIEYFVSFR